MDSGELIKLITEYGADTVGINSRFNGNTDLYKKCFFKFLDEPCFAELDTAL